MLFRPVVGSGLLFVMTFCSVPPASSDRQYIAEIETWRSARLARLKSDDGWLTVIALFWLESGANTVGSARGNGVLLPSGKAPERLGTIERIGKTASFRPEPGTSVTANGNPITQPLAMCDDSVGEPTKLRHGGLTFFLIRRGDRLGVRVKDRDSEARRVFTRIEQFPINPDWRIEAQFEPYDPPREIPVPNVLGQTDREKSPGALLFMKEGKTYRLDPVLERGETDWFVIFGDQTNGRETYGGGRFLSVSPPVAGRTIIDFNKAYNPPCVFTPYATCPLPPAGNRLPIRVEAGEKNYGHHDH